MKAGATGSRQILVNGCCSWLFTSRGPAYSLLRTAVKYNSAGFYESNISRKKS